VGAILQNESETSRITGVNGGSVTAFASAVNAPNQLNIGNLGAMLTSSANLGTVSIMRVHLPVTNSGHPAMHGIERAYLIQPTNDVALDATLRFYYLDAELDGNDTSTLSLWRSNDGVNWAQVGFDSRNSTQKYVEKQGISKLSWWTLSSTANPLPLVQTTFKVTCDGPVALVQWQTGEESNLDYFLVQRSSNGEEWSTLNTVAATNNPVGSSYVFKDNQPAGTSYYRVGIADRGGTIGYSPAFSGGCSDIALPLMIYPNPAASQAVQTVEKLPIRTADLHPAVSHTAPVALPIKSGGLGDKTITSAQPGAFKAILPPMKQGSATVAGSIKGTPAGRPGDLQPGGATGGAGSTTVPIKGTGTGGTNKQ
jgi:hypothetical protein